MPETVALSDSSPTELARAVAWRSARFGARQSRRALRRLPQATRQLRAVAPNGPIARMADRGYSLWSTDARFSVASVKSQGSAWSAWSLLSAGSVGSLFSIGSVLSVGSAGSILSIGSAGSILSIGSAGSICSIGSAGNRRLPMMASDDEAPDELDGPDTGDHIGDDIADGHDDVRGGADVPTGLSVIERGGTLLGLLAVAGALATPRPI